jgi:hypothetical protein
MHSTSLSTTPPQAGAVPHVTHFACEFHLDSQFVQMLRGYRASGGMMRRYELVRQLRMRSARADQQLECWIAERRVCVAPWRGHNWLPMFQFTAQHLTPKPAVKTLLGDLDPAFVGWDACRWFAEPNPGLAGAVPAALIDTDAEALRQLARADRYAVLG